MGIFKSGFLLASSWVELQQWYFLFGAFGVELERQCPFESEQQCVRSLRGICYFLLKVFVFKGIISFLKDLIFFYKYGIYPTLLRVNRVKSNFTIAQRNRLQCALY